MDNDNCPLCGHPEGLCESYGEPELVACLKRQLAAANERAGRIKVWINAPVAFTPEGGEFRRGHDYACSAIREILREALEVPDAL